jgi:hypothetical protein
LINVKKPEPNISCLGPFKRREMTEMTEMTGIEPNTAVVAGGRRDRDERKQNTLAPLVATITIEQDDVVGSSFTPPPPIPLSLYLPQREDILREGSK